MRANTDRNQSELFILPLVVVEGCVHRQVGGGGRFVLVEALPLVSQIWCIFGERHTVVSHCRFYQLTFQREKSKLNSWVFGLDVESTKQDKSVRGVDESKVIFVEQGRRGGGRRRGHAFATLLGSIS